MKDLILLIEDRDGEEAIINLAKMELIYNDGYGGVFCMDSGKQLKVKADPKELMKDLKHKKEEITNGMAKNNLKDSGDNPDLSKVQD